MSPAARGGSIKHVIGLRVSVDACLAEIRAISWMRERLREFFGHSGWGGSLLPESMSRGRIPPKGKRGFESVVPENI